MSAPNTQLAERLRKQADALKPKIEQKLKPAIGEQRLTPRRARIAEGIRKEGCALRDQQQALYKLAYLHERGECPAELADIKQRTEVEQILCEWRQDPRRELLYSLLEPLTAAEQAAKKIKELERDLIGAKIPGFFPTPAPVIEIMLQEAQIQPGMAVLEPSAGKGDIAAAVAATGAAVDCIEFNHRLHSLIAARHEVQYLCRSNLCADFLDVSPSMYRERFARVLMNPPFEKGQDCDHIRHAFTFLKPGGRLVAIMCEGPFMRSDSKSVEFRDWLLDREAICYKLPDGSFDKAFRSTGVATRLLIIDNIEPTDAD